MDRGDWRATYSPWDHRESDTTEQLTFHPSRCAHWLCLDIREEAHRSRISVTQFSSVAQSCLTLQPHWTAAC